MAEYEAWAIGVEATLSIGLKRLEVYGDSSLIICQMQGKWKTTDEKLIPYQEHVETLSREFKEITFSYLPKDNNRLADAFATLASMVEMESEIKVHPITINLRHQPAYINHIYTLKVDGRPWYASIVDLIREERYLKDAITKEKHFLRRYDIQFILQEDILYKRSYDGVQLLCVDEE
ncbi:uncharacterized protein LOC122665557 [Telopea speciosissima]|uniref:uncharacterized protein LOC122665557 n=1 Tax=Telopea speciosissima TaxID=54955 RepID=UPI001CC73F7E|nr:uncharacterized protein LOC122665557 [Telopea speciosissima]